MKRNTSKGYRSVGAEEVCGYVSVGVVAALVSSASHGRGIGVSEECN